MILVLGATGNTGGEVARQLVAAGERPRLLLRDPQKGRAFADQADLVRGDLDDPASLGAAMQGVDRVYLVSAGADLVRIEGQVVDAAVAGGVRHVVKLSVLGADQPTMTFARWHAESERRLTDSGLAWTMLRPVNFTSNSLAWAGTIREHGAFYQPTGAGRWAAIDPADIAAVAVRALTEPGHEGEAYELTGSEAMDAAGYAAVLSRVLGRPVRFVDVPPEAAREGMARTGLPPVFVDALMELNAAMKAGRLAAVTDTVERVLGRPPAAFEDWARRHAGAFA
jgi:uncharacterized protein YbjT (DUF2867 family)